MVLTFCSFFWWWLTRTWRKDVLYLGDHVSPDLCSCKYLFDHSHLRHFCLFFVGYLPIGHGGDVRRWRRLPWLLRVGVPEIRPRGCWNRNRRQPTSDQGIPSEWRVECRYGLALLFCLVLPFVWLCILSGLTFCLVFPSVWSCLSSGRAFHPVFPFVKFGLGFSLVCV